MVNLIKGNSGVHVKSMETYNKEKCNSPIIITKITYGTVSAKIAPPLKCYKNASRLNRYNFPTDYAIDFLFSTLHREMV